MRIMIIGASNERHKFGNKAVRAHLRQKHTVLPVNPNEEQVEGQRAWPTVKDVPGPIDRALFYVPARIGLQVIDALAERGDVSEVWLNPGAESEELIARARELGFDPIMACAIIDIGERP
ncbi:MAG: CoA-binding protein [Phycisphaerales bacterium]|nr:CoA-binding protein [Phycisphaerales bacterium]